MRLATLLFIPLVLSACAGSAPASTPADWAALVDAVNVTARIEGQCHALEARLLVSEAALALAPLPSGIEANAVATVSLRGRTGALSLIRVAVPNASPLVEPATA